MMAMGKLPCAICCKRHHEADVAYYNRAGALQQLHALCELQVQALC